MSLPQARVQEMVRGSLVLEEGEVGSQNKFRRRIRAPDMEELRRRCRKLRNN